MNSTQKWYLLKELQPLDEAGEIITNKELFYLMKDSTPFSSQEALDDAVAELILKKKISPFTVVEDKVCGMSKKLKDAIINA